MCISFVENWSSNLYITSPQLSILCLRTRDKFLTILCNSQRKMRIPAPGMAAGLGICPHRSRRPSQYLPPSKIFYDMVPFKKKLDRLLTSAKHNNVLDNKEFKFLTTASPIAPTLYLLPKIHKSTQEPPGSSIQDTSHLIRQLQDLTVPDNTILVTMAVTSLYTCIGHTLGIEAVSDFLNQQITGDRRHQSFILDLLAFVPSNSYFVFDRVFYKQISGTAMGARCAPSYANLFMGWWEETQVHPLQDFKTNFFCWFRYIDDLLVLWTGSETECRNFIATLNSNELNISLTASPSMTSVDFLDLKVIKAGNRIQTKIFRKTTAANNLLHFSCFHPRHLRNNLPKGQFLRGRRKPGNTPTADQGTWFTY
ncbi:uncharacterized protein LOC143788937 isoform X2 [Ranitomeya variabilis]|uniref:uncharacterized protein LOC143788937 isoform X2 n=1 Tax=Ranitomeya variabilis TaxID=490064 RepID=UPI0040562804